MQHYNTRGLSIIIPVYNENKNILILAKKLNNIKKKIKTEIIFIDDNSNDGSIHLLKFVKKKYNTQFLIRRKKNRDLMNSCFMGIKKSKYNTCLIMDGDLQHNPKYIPGLYKKLNSSNYDIGICCRKFDKLKNKDFNFLRKYSSLIIIFLINIFLEKKTADPLSGFFIFRKKIFNSFKFFYYPSGYKILLNILYCTNIKLKLFDKIIIFDRRISNKSKMNKKVLFNLVVQFFYLLYVKLFKKIIIDKNN